jgi:hypothetical protein
VTLDDADQGVAATVDVSSGPETAEDEPAQSRTSQGESMSFWSTLAKERTKRIEARADSRARRAEAAGRGGRGGGKRRAAARRAEAAEAAAAGFTAEAMELERMAAEDEAAAEGYGSGMPSWLIPAAIAGVALFALRK